MRHLTLLLGAAASILSIAVAHAGLGDQLFKLLADDGADSDFFGISVAISGETAIVGAYQHGDFVGSAYLFDVATGLQIYELLPEGGLNEDFFGVSVSISGAIAIVGANGTGSAGAAYLYDVATGQQITKLLPDDGAWGDEFGLSVAINGTTVLVGSPEDDDNGSYSGSAYLFDATTGQEIAKLLADDGETGDQFGSAVAISGTTAIVGAKGDDDNGGGSGSAYLFDISDPANPTQIAKILPDNRSGGAAFGSTVAISGVTAVVGNGIVSGAAYLFDATTGQQISTLLPDDDTGYFGTSVGISGDTIIVGAWHDSDNSIYAGAAYFFDTNTGQQIAKVLPDDGEAWDYLGYAVAISGETAIVGAPGDDDNAIDSGSAYLLDAAFNATLFFEPDQPYLSEADSPLDENSAGFILENFEDGLFNIPGVSVSGGDVRFPGPFTDSVDLDDGVLDGFGTDGHVFRPPDGETSLTFTFDAEVLGQLPTQAGLVWTDGNSQAVVTFTAENAQGICVVETQVTLGDDVHNGETAEDRFFGVAFADGIGALSISTSFGGLEVDHVQLVVPCQWDLDGSGDIGVGDLLVLLANWANPYGVSDLLALLANWGPCP